MKYLSLILFILLFACTAENKNDSVEQEDTSKSDVEIVKQTLLSSYDFINNEDLTDSLTFNQYKSFFDDAFVMLPREGKPLSNKETILEGQRRLFKTHKGNFDVTIDQIEVSGDLAYVLYHYHEVFTNIETGENLYDIMHSAIAVLKKDMQGNWKMVVGGWT